MRAVLDTDTVTLIWRYKSPTVQLNASRYLTQYGRLTFTEFTYYEIIRGLHASQAIKQLAEFKSFCQQHELLPFTHAAAAEQQ